uniref:Uncharacterized protein n=1 Tax=Arundo donax TaxID=35708 RepID=A0A0A8ZHF2_ARUDO
MRFCTICRLVFLLQFVICYLHYIPSVPLHSFTYPYLNLLLSTSYHVPHPLTLLNV